MADSGGSLLEVVVRVLMSSPSGLGHINPLVPIASAFVANGDEVLFGCAGPADERLSALGFRVSRVGLDAPDAHQRALDRFPELRDLPGSQMATQMFPRLFGSVGTDASFTDLLAVAHAFQPNVIVHDAADFAAPIVAASIGVPNVCNGFGFLVPPERVQDAADRAVRWWKEVGLEPRSFGGCYDHLYIDPYPPSMQPFGLDHVPNIIRCAPAAASSAQGETLPEGLTRQLEDPSNTLILVTFGTVYNRSADVAATVHGAARIDSILLVTIGLEGDVSAFGDLGQRAHVHTYVPLNLVLPHTTVLASHAGSGTALAALAGGIPQLCVPQAADQFRNAEAIEQAGAGRRLTDGVDADMVERELRFLLDDNATRERAGLIANEIASMPSAAEVAAAISALVVSWPA